jgi:hypothetical protein
MIWVISVIILSAFLVSWLAIIMYQRRIYGRREYINSGHQQRIRELESRLADHIAQREKNARDREHLERLYSDLLVDYTARKEACDGTITQLQDLVRDRGVLDQLESELELESGE